MKKALAAILSTLALVISALPAAADEALVERWYQALLAVDRDGLSSLLADEAIIKLTDLEVEQSKSEFIASMDEWQVAAEGAAIRHRIVEKHGTVMTVLACYDFPGNDMLMQETFTVTGSLIVENTQATVAENCDTF
ncbi:nuclear transport factor 2 family protein [Pseudaminobacter arsenicus]|uniref:Nuclear transport factor 2 family protein n=1 Tax=Borborobacter arsenicus TaxID=1851146 RepID=A0A432V651_9HYPH|nr:nuclear transport factor 2 family protein [Pseudaminobacter arsenicus]RUM97625.1 nuclear transport factor 2 family protein [Pseudaminobacter arsenicus]